MKTRAYTFLLVNPLRQKATFALETRFLARGWHQLLAKPRANAALLKRVSVSESTSNAVLDSKVEHELPSSFTVALSRTDIRLPVPFAPCKYSTSDIEGFEELGVGSRSLGDVAKLCASTPPLLRSSPRRSLEFAKRTKTFELEPGELATCSVGVELESDSQAVLQVQLVRSAGFPFKRTRAVAEPLVLVFPADQQILPVCAPERPTTPKPAVDVPARGLS